MTISVACPGCSQKLEAPEKLSGKRVKCPKCGGAVEISSPSSGSGEAMADDELQLAPIDEPKREQPSASSSDGTAAPSKDAEQLEPFSLLDEFGTEDEAAMPALASAATLPASQTKQRPAGQSHKIVKRLTQRWLGLLVGVVAVAVLLLLSLQGHYILGPVFGLIGLAIAAREILADNATERRAKRRHENMLGGIGGGLAGMFFVVMIGGRILRGAAASSESASSWLGPAAIIAGVLFLLVGLLLIAAKVAMRFGVFRSVSIGYLIVALALPLLAPLFSGEFGGSRSVATYADHRSAPVPDFPPRGTPREITDGIRFFDTRLNVDSKQPGNSGRIYAYLPPGEHADQSLGCVFMAPAGATNFTGMALSGDDLAEHRKFLLAGYAVVAYEVDGPFVLKPEWTDREMMARYRPAYDANRAAHAGLVNARNAIEFALATFPEIDPQRLFVAGHSSAGRVALLVAANEPRIKACMAFAAVSDVEKSVGDEIGNLSTVLPGVRDYVKRYSPKNQAGDIQCPVFLFHARDDKAVPFAQSQQFAALLDRKGVDVTFRNVAAGGHYQSMMRDGIPLATEWLKKTLGAGGRPARPSSETDPAVAQKPTTPKDPTPAVSRPTDAQRPPPVRPRSESSAPATLPAPEVVTWSSVVDPPNTRLEYPEDFRLMMKPPRAYDIQLPGGNSPYVFIPAYEQNSVVHLLTKKTVGDLGKFRVHKPYALSPDGQLFVSSQLSEPLLDVRSTKDGRVLPALNLATGAGDRSRPRIRFMEFSGPEQLVLLKESSGQLSVETWNVPGATRTKQFVVTEETSSNFGKFPVLSPGGRFLAMMMDQDIEVFELSQGKRVAHLSLSSDRKWKFYAKALAFSPDGKQLSALLSIAYHRDFTSKVRLLSWDCATGKTLMDHDYGDEVERASQRSAKGSPALQWTPELSGLVLNGRVVIDRASGAPVWEFAEQPCGLLISPDKTLISRHRELYTAPFPSRQIAVVAKSIQAGGEAIDAALPPLTAADIAAARKITPDDRAIDWTLTPDPARSPNTAAGPYHGPRNIALNASGFEQGLVAASDPPTAVLHTVATSGQSRTQQVANVLQAINLSDGTPQGKLHLPMGRQRLFSVGPDGNDVLVGFRLRSFAHPRRLDIWSLRDGKHRVGWRPYRQETDEEARFVTDAALVGDDTALTLNKRGALVCWDLPACRARYRIDDVESLIGMTPGYKYLFLAHRGLKDEIQIYETRTGERRGILPASRLLSGDATLFRPDGKMLVQVQRDKVLVWNLADGTRQAFPIPEMPGFQVSADWLSDRYLLVGGSLVIDLERMVLAWQYFWPAAAQFVGVANQHVWLALPGGVTGVPVDLARIDAVAAELTPEKQAILYPGARVKVSASAVAAKHMTQRLEANGCVVEPQAPIVVALAVSQRATGDVWRVQTHGGTGPIRLKQETVREQRTYWTLSVSNPSQGKQWSSSSEIHMPGSVGVKPEQSTAQAYQEALSKESQSVREGGIYIPAWVFPRPRSATGEGKNLLGNGETNLAGEDAMRQLAALPGGGTLLNAQQPAAVSLGELGDANHEYMQSVYADLIAGDGERLKQLLRWYPGGKRPVVGIRWGIGVTLPGKTQQPEIRSPEDFQKLAGPIGLAIVQGLEQRKSEGAFGNLPLSADPRVGKRMVAGGTATDLLAEARRRELDALVLITLKTKRTLQGKIVDSTMQVRVMDVRGRQKAWTSSPLSRRDLQEAVKKGRDAVGDFVADIFEHIDGNYRLRKMPNMTVDVAARRAASLTASSTSDWRPVLAELRYYHTVGLLSDVAATRHYTTILGSEVAVILASGDAAARQTALRKWLAQQK